MKYLPSLYWYDYETFGVDPRRDRPAQFAGVRTDLELNPIGDPLTLFCRLSDDYLPHPEACLITGITPQQVNAQGLPEAEFIARIRQELIQPNTTLVGYNNIRFDDEVTRFTLYRNLYDAYAHEWQNGNSRWDILDVMRLTHALRPEGIQWPKNDEGVTSFRLDQLTQANGIAHEAAHDATSDVLATIAMAKLVREQQPKLYEFVYTHRSKQKVSELLNLANPVAVLHVSSMYPASSGCIALVAPLIQHPVNKNEILVYDLRYDPDDFLSLSVDELQQRLYSRQEDLPEGIARLPVKSIHINKCPIVVPVNTLTPAAAEKWSIDVGQSRDYLQKLVSATAFKQNLRSLFLDNSFAPNTDPDFMLYDGGFFSSDDKAAMDAVHDMTPEQLSRNSPRFNDKRLVEMLFRYRARNYPETLSQDEKEAWRMFCQRRITHSSENAGLSIKDYVDAIIAMQSNRSLTRQQEHILHELISYGESVQANLV